jgi:hypothetical protein
MADGVYTKHSTPFSPPASEASGAGSGQENQLTRLFQQFSVEISGGSLTLASRRGDLLV